MPARAQLRGDADRSFGKARPHRDLAGHADRRQGHRHRADQSDRRRGDPLSPALAGKSRRRARPAARPRRQGDAGAGRAGGAAERRQSARRHHAHRNGHLSSPPVRPALHRRFFRRPFCAIAGRRRPRRARRRKHRRDRLDPRQRFSPQAEAACGIALGPRPVRARLLFARAAGTCGRPRGARCAGRWTTVLCGRSDLAGVFLDRAWGEGQRESGRRRK